MISQEKVKTYSAKKEARAPSAAWLFDVDGVLANLKEKKVTEKEIFSLLEQRLSRKQPVGINTGRSTEFLIKQILDPLERFIKEKSDLQNVFVVGEKGGIQIEYDLKGHKVLSVNKDINVPEDLKERIKRIAIQPDKAKVMFFDDKKRTMITVEIRPGVSHAEFVKAQQEFNEEANNLIVSLLLNKQIRIDATSISTDIEDKRVGKALGARMFTGFLDRKGIEPVMFFCYGDRPSDYDMHEELLKLGKESYFIFVDDKKFLKDKDLSRVIFTRQRFEKGTIEHLQKGS